MTSRELVMKAFAHEESDRVPCWCGASPAFWDKAKASFGLGDEALSRRLGDDFRRLVAPWRGPASPLSPGATSRGPFGVERSGVGGGQAMSHPLARVASRGAILGYPWPDPADVDVSGLRAAAAAWGGEFAVLGGDWSPLWHDAIDLIDMGHGRGMKVMLHCCGGFRPLIPLMLRDGIDALHALRPNCAGMEMRALKRDFGSRILLNGGIDSQRVLIEGDPAFVREETLRTLAVMAPGGGYVAGASHD